MQISLSGNDVLRLVIELFETSGEWPGIDVDRAQIRHWNGQPISVNREEIVELVHSGLLDLSGEWTDAGRRELACFAGLEDPDALVYESVKSA